MCRISVVLLSLLVPTLQISLLNNGLQKIYYDYITDRGVTYIQFTLFSNTIGYIAFGVGASVMITLIFSKKRLIWSIATSKPINQSV